MKRPFDPSDIIRLLAQNEISPEEYYRCVENHRYWGIAEDLALYLFKDKKRNRPDTYRITGYLRKSDLPPPSEEMRRKILAHIAGKHREQPNHKSQNHDRDKEKKDG